MLPLPHFQIVILQADFCQTGIKFCPPHHADGYFFILAARMGSRVSLNLSRVLPKIHLLASYRLWATDGHSRSVQVLMLCDFCLLSTTWASSSLSPLDTRTVLPLLMPEARVLGQGCQCGESTQAPGRWPKVMSQLCHLPAEQGA